MSGYRIRNTQKKTAANQLLRFHKTSWASSRRSGNLIQTESMQSPYVTHPYMACCRSRACPRKSRFSPPPSLIGKRYAAALPLAGMSWPSTSWDDLCMQGASHRTESGASAAPRGWQHAAVAGCHLECGEMLLVEAGFRPKPGDLETPQVGNSAELCGRPTFLPSLCRSGLRCDCGKRCQWVWGSEPHRSTGRGLGPTCQTPFWVFWKRSFVGVNSNGRRGFVTSSLLAVLQGKKGL